MSKKNRKEAERSTVHVGLLIDETGSMTGMEPAVIGGVNEFIESLRKQEADSRVLATLAMFDLHGSDPVLRVKYSGIPLEEVDVLGQGDYTPRGSTPLNDAVVRTIRSIDAQVKGDDRAMLVILTDGLENSSETATADVRKLIHSKEKDGWEFIYLGANQDAWAEAQKIGIARPGRAFSYDATADGVADAHVRASERVRSFRTSREQYEAEAEELDEGDSSTRR
jgi:uncharacterized protein YegL